MKGITGELQPRQVLVKSETVSKNNQKQKTMEQTKKPKKA
jgi:hypothetical protein